MTTHTWFITGSSRGFGRSLAVAALAAGDRVVATARKPEQLDDLVSQYGDQVLPVALDVTDAAAATDAFTAAEERFGRVDVVVNNAGYANSRRSRPPTRQISGGSSRPISGASTTCRKRRFRCCVVTAGAS